VGVVFLKKLGGEVDGRVEGIVAGLSRLVMGIPPLKKKKKKKERGEVFVCLIPLGVEQSWQGDFLSLARNFPWMHYTGTQNRKGVEGSY
jgi:hypothetical protein